jgi:hypothetical protein
MLDPKIKYPPQLTLTISNRTRGVELIKKCQEDDIKINYRMRWVYFSSKLYKNDYITLCDI